MPTENRNPKQVHNTTVNIVEIKAPAVRAFCPKRAIMSMPIRMLLIKLKICEIIMGNARLMIAFTSDIKDVFIANISNVMVANFNQFTVGISKPNFILIWTLIRLILNIFLGYLLIFGKYGFPKLGVSGFALSTLISSWFICFVIFLIYKIHRTYQHYQSIFCKLMLDRKLLILLLKIGWPISIQLGGELGIFTVIAMQMGIIGTVVLASQQIVQQTITVMMIIPFCLSQAAAILISQAAGENDIESIQSVSLSVITLSTIISLAAGAIYFLDPKLIINLFINTNELKNRNIVAIAVVLFRVAAFYQVFDGVRNVITGALRGIQDTKKPMQITLCTLWIVAIPIGTLLAFEFKIGPTGPFLGLVIGVMLLTALLGRRLYNEIFLQKSKQFAATVP